MFSKKELEQKIEPAIPLLKEYWNLVLKWQKVVNLISDNTIKEGWNRHVLDSAQLYFLIPESKKILLDVGSGGGFPGLVFAILNKVLKGSLKEITLVESDLKKSLFLEEVVRVLNLQVVVLNERIEKIQLRPDVITARAFAPLDRLFLLLQKNVSRETILILPKGKSVDEEIKNVPLKASVEKIQNCVNPEGCVLKIEGVEYV